MRGRREGEDGEDGKREEDEEKKYSIIYNLNILWEKTNGNGNVEGGWSGVAVGRFALLGGESSNGSACSFHEGGAGRRDT